MAKKKASKSSTSSWWDERSKIMSMKSETKTARPKKKVKSKKVKKAETGETYICEICGCEMVCASDSAGEIICCGEPMALVIL